MSEPIITAPAVLKVYKKARAEEFMLNWIKAADGPKRSRQPIWNEVRDNYFVTPRSLRGGSMGYSGGALGTRWAIPQQNLRRSLLKDPESHQIIEALLAKIIALGLGNVDYVVAEPTGNEDYNKAATVSRLIETALRSPGSYRTMFEGIKGALMYGNYLVECGWEIEDDIVLKRIPIVDEFGTTATVFDYKKSRLKDDAFLRTRHVMDVWRDPSATRFNESEGVVIRFRTTADRARAVAREYKRWDIDEVEEAIKGGHSASDQAYGEYRDSDEWGDLPDEFRPMVGFDFWGKVPWDPDDGTEVYKDGIRRRNLTVLNGRCVGDGPNPLLNGRIPLVDLVPNPVADSPWGVTPLEVVRFLQDATDTLLSLVQDASIEAVRGTLLVETGSMADPESIRSRKVGDVLKVLNKEGIGVLPLQTNGFFQAAGQLLQGKMTMRHGSGANDTLQGISGGGRRSATEADALMRSALGRADTMTRSLEEDALPIIGKHLLLLFQQFIPDEGAIIRRIGEKNSFRAQFMDIDGDYDLFFSGSRTSVNKGERQKQLLDTIMILQSNPFVASQVDWFKLIGTYLNEGLQLRDYENFLKSPEQALGQLQAMGMASGGANTPGRSPIGNAQQAEAAGTAMGF